MKKHEGNYILRTATLEDSQLLYNWVNDATVRNMSINSKIISWAEHNKWLNKNLGTTTFKILILEYDENPVGQIRYEYIERYWLIDYSVDCAYRGMGFGKKLLELSISLFSNCQIRATVKKDNFYSNHIFINSGFILDGEEIINGMNFARYLLECK